MEVLSVGEVLIDWVSPERGATLNSAETFHPAPGGAPANVAVGLSRLGVKAGFAGKLSRDAWGERLLGLLRAEGIDTRGVIRDDEADTRMAYVLLDEAGERHLAAFSKQAADQRLTASEVDGFPLEGVKILYMSSMMQAQRPSQEAFRRMVARAKEAGALLVYDPNYRSVLWTDPPGAEARRTESQEAKPRGSEARAAEALEEACRQADLIKLGTEELAFLSGTRDLRDGMRQIWERFDPALLVVTDGPMGSFWKNSASEGHVQAIAVPTLDPTGAGDGFVAGLLAGLLEEGADPATVRWLPQETMEPLLRRANGVGALVATKLGAMTALPTRQELDAWLLSCE
ncbi:5-dehydro-2-deoxygluconokinase [compost metagenome]